MTNRFTFADLIKSKAPKGFSPIPGSKKGGYRKKSSSGWDYWYPDGKGTRSSAKSEDGDKPHSATEEGGKRLKVKDTENLSDGVKQRLAKYNLEVVAEAGSTPEKAIEIATRLEEGIDKAADICQSSPPICAGNMGIPRADMPQIMDEPIKNLLASKDPEEVKKGEAAVAAGADPEAEKSPFDMMLDHFKSEGGGVSEPSPIPVGQLKATQKDIKDGKATFFAETQMKGEWPNGAKADLSTKPIVISNDGHILDGHHRWAALLMLGPDMTMNAITVDMPMHELLDKSFDTPGAGVFRMDLQNEVIEGDKPDYKAYKEKADANMQAATVEAQGERIGKLEGKNLDDKARAHAKERFAMMKEKGQTGKLTEAQYVEANLESVKENIQSGMEPDGKGGYKGGYKKSLAPSFGSIVKAYRQQA